MEGWNRRVLLGALRRPDSVYYWARASIRLRENRTHGREADRFAVARTDPVTALRRVGVLGPSPSEESEIRSRYHGLRALIDECYGRQAQGRIPSVVTEEDALLLYAVVRSLSPEVVVETGVSDGMSSAIILAALEKNGRGTLHSIDFPLMGIPRLYRRMPGWVVPEQYRRRWQLRLGPSHRLLEPLLREVGPIGVFFHDSEHSFAQMSWEFRTALSHLCRGGVVISDDVFANDAFSEICSATPGAAWATTSGGMGLLRPSGP